MLLSLLWSPLSLFYYSPGKISKSGCSLPSLQCNRLTDYCWRKSLNHAYWSYYYFMPTTLKLVCGIFLEILYPSLVHVFFYSPIGLLNTLDSFLKMPAHFSSLSVCSKMLVLLIKQQQTETEKNFYKLLATHILSYLTSALSSLTWVHCLCFNWDWFEH